MRYKMALCLVLLLACILTACGGSNPSITSSSTGQEILPTLARVEDAVAARFTQTAQVQTNIQLTQTMDAAFGNAVTATAAFQATVDAQFNQALTATADAKAVQNAQAALTVLAASRLNPVSIDLTNAQQIKPLATMPLDDYGSLSFTPDGMFMISSGHKWDMTNGVSSLITSQLPYHTGTSPNGKIVADQPNYKGNIEFHDTLSGALKASIKPQADGQRGIRFVTFSNDGRFAAINGCEFIIEDNQSNPCGHVTTIVVDVEGGRVLYVIEESQVTTAAEASRINFEAAAFSPTAKYIATGDSSGRVRLRDTATGQTVATFQGNSQGTLAGGSVVFSPDETKILLIGCNPQNQTNPDSCATGTAWVWDVASGKSLFTLQDGRYIATAVFSPDGKLIATAGADKSPDLLDLWDANTGQMLGTFRTGITNTANSLAFTPNGALLAVGVSNNKVIQLWGVQTLTDEVKQTLVATVAPPLTITAAFNEASTAAAIPAMTQHAPETATATVLNATATAYAQRINLTYGQTITIDWSECANCAHSGTWGFLGKAGDSVTVTITWDNDFNGSGTMFILGPDPSTKNLTDVIDTYNKNSKTLTQTLILPSDGLYGVAIFGQENSHAGACTVTLTKN